MPILGLVTDDNSDSLVLRMLGQLLLTSGCTMQIVTDTESSLQIVERVAEHSPRLVVVSHLPPEGSTLARYLVRRLRAHFTDLPIVVGRWGETDGTASAVERLVGVGASRVVFTLADARAQILSVVVREQKGATVATALSV
jgi:methylmalonyl-CoA mutase cobalamin-binding subunit